MFIIVSKRYKVHQTIAGCQVDTRVTQFDCIPTHEPPLDQLLPGPAGPGGSGFLISEISERNSNYSICNPDQTGKKLVSDWITNTRYDYELRERIMRQHGSRKVIRLEKKINVESNYVTLLIDRGKDGGCGSGVHVERCVKNNLGKSQASQNEKIACAKIRIRTRARGRMLIFSHVH